MSDHVDIIIIGAGVIGLSVARALSLAGKNVLILEREKSFGMGVSSRNSEVIHAGLYFDADMLKSSLCVRGKEMLYQYAAERHIPHKRCGKLLVASSEAELPKLEQIKLNAENCGVNDLRMLSKADCSALEPDISAVAGIFSPSSGVIDSHSLMLCLLADTENSGGQVVFNTVISAIEKTAEGFKVTTNDDYSISCDILINAAGLGAMTIANMIDVLDKSHIPDLIMAKGNYFSYSAKTSFNHLVYPLPFQGGLGVHLTLDTAGGVKFGPDVKFIEHEEYTVSPSLKNDFLNSIRHYFPTVDPEKLNADYAGIRPKLSKDGLDFCIQFEKDHKIKGLINLFGIESPGLTASLAIADYIKEKI
ncbi:MAG: NAD(P)/FAD-dependent oxidoreductase [Kordiimonadaceae bacterium]|nr:NAD(P)/FAD-dependent oxidoreductase [Gammaproteobacteria bacterium]MBT5073739.1 NAD(P)/FAD-dependent oxidoreductase [Kordiimonadaceae bacterium]MBT6036926.1 NAD(P)/FAD-dependent oxidoreductase [Kordiimonadaceae bacterium]MBT6330724.1 NAD(P)/FAD-dependent oxidoreductase [Kordiimonadaceae bacterium]MBT7581312.1 NAD(P)/FAD-dependent oxidoreductase [Kordiimonadaceae bacterium]